MSDWSESVDIMNDMQIAKLIKKKKRLLVLLNDYDTGYTISAVVLSQNFEIIEIVLDEICRQWLRNGCNGFDMKSPISNPMSFWTEQDVLQYIKQNNLPISKVYGEVVVKDDGGYQYGATLCDCGKLCTTGAKRTGCIFCMYGAHCKGDERFLLLKKNHPRQYEYCMGGGAYDTDGFWKPTKDGLGMKHVIDEINKIYGDGFIKY